MKNILFLLASILCLFYFSSCEKNAETKTHKHTIRTSINPFDEVGIIHNKALTFVLSNYSKNYQHLKSTDDALFVNTLTALFIKRQDPSQKSQSMTFHKSFDFLKELTTTTKGGFKSKTEDFVWLTINQKKYINELSAIIKANSTNSSNILDKIELIEKQIIESKMTVEEQSIPLLFAAVGKNSFLYWDEFVSKNKIDATKLKGRISWKDVAIGDAMGVVVGAGKGVIKAGAASLVFGPTGIVMTAASGAVLGAIEGSVGGAISSWIGSWIKYQTTLDNNGNIIYPDDFPEELKGLTIEELKELFDVSKKPQ